MLVEGEHQLGRELPYRGRDEIHPVDRSEHALYDRPDMTDYDRLSSLDASFLHLERPEYPMHVGAVSVLEGAPFFDADGRFRIAEVRDLVLSRLPLMPRFRRRLMAVPYEQGRPIWVDDDRFDITYHVRHTALPRPGSWEQLVALTTRIQEGLLDRDRPLWEIWLVEGLEGGNVALLQKTHHALDRRSVGCRRRDVVARPPPRVHRAGRFRMEGGARTQCFATPARHAARAGDRARGDRAIDPLRCCVAPGARSNAPGR